MCTYMTIIIRTCAHVHMCMCTCTYYTFVVRQFLLACNIPCYHSENEVHICKYSHGLLRGSCSSEVRASTAKVGGLGFDPQWLPMHFFLQDVSMLIYHQLLTTSSYHQLLLIRSYKK